MDLINQAMSLYGVSYGEFPPAWTVDAQGKPMHSWRTLLLPYMSRSLVTNDEDLNYNYETPWNSPENIDFLENSKNPFRCLCDCSQSNTTTSYLMIIGDDCISDGITSLRLSNIGKNRSEIMWCIESAESHIEWTEPRDFPSKNLSLGISPPFKNENMKILRGRSFHKYEGGCFGIQAATLDGKTISLNANTSYKILNILSNTNDKRELIAIQSNDSSFFIDYSVKEHDFP